MELEKNATARVWKKRVTLFTQEVGMKKKCGSEEMS
jgi:hypothetical protein